MLPRLPQFLILSGVITLSAACDPNVVIGAKWRVDEGGLGGQVGAGGSVGGGGGTTAGSEPAVGGTAAGEGGTPTAEAGAGGGGGAGGGPDEVEEWCATAPWVNEPVQFSSESGNVIPAGPYVLEYVSGAQIHDVGIGYEVTGHYYVETLEAGHHLFSADNPKGLWLEATGLVPGKTVAEVEAVNGGHTWQLDHTGGELSITLYDNDYRDNSGPGSRFCVTAAVP